MAGKIEKSNTFLWLLRGFTSAFLLGYIISLYMALVIVRTFPSGNHLEDILGLVFLLVFLLGYYLMWIRREILGGIIFIIWYAALWPAEIFVGGNTFEGSPLPGILMLILGVLFLVYRSAELRRKSEGKVVD